MAILSPKAKPISKVKAVVVVAAIAVVAVFPLVFTNPAVTEIAIFALMFMATSEAWNGFAGWSGYFSLGHAAFFGVGAYTFAIIANDNKLAAGSGLFLLMPVAGVVAMVAAVLVGAVALRTKRHTFVVITIGVFFIFQLLGYNLSITAGASGLQVPTPYNWDAATFNNPFYYAAAILLGFTVGLYWIIRRSAFGLQLLAIRDDEERAKGLGVPVWRVKLSAFVISSFPVGMAGALFAFLIGQIYPNTVFNPLFDLSWALMTLVGGIGTIAGPLLGGVVLESVQQYLNLYLSNADIYLIVYGVVFLAVMFWMPRGVVPTVGDALRRRRGAGEAAPVATNNGSTGSSSEGKATGSLAGVVQEGGK